MSDHYLLLRAGASEYLLAMTHVIEVGLIDDSAAGATHRAWRDRLLDVRNLTASLGSAADAQAIPQHQVVVRNGDDLQMLDVDAITGLRIVDAKQLVPFLATTARTAQFVDRAWPQADGRCALRLRWPLPD